MEIPTFRKTVYVSRSGDGTSVSDWSSNLLLVCDMMRALRASQHMRATSPRAPKPCSIDKQFPLVITVTTLRAGKYQSMQSAGGKTPFMYLRPIVTTYLATAEAGAIAISYDCNSLRRIA